ncbi:hypothetical protein DUT91_06800 [Phyllobacterium salinisoli]|uniref:Anti-sigma factor NepR domain-containing protein n=1 Tax=Phyllobacterium salinisoli TaxID=1899321 RepID=A0A368K6Y2_9HYPH|nr:hypothetical protein [Phyllobacterium salinisoli]RCS25127.1 hypothetical protein DUT91_06800 [Phyllobacterium salinisoli]
MERNEKNMSDKGETPLERLDEELRHFGEFIASIPVPAETRQLWDQLQLQLLRQLGEEKAKGKE